MARLDKLRGGRATEISNKHRSRHKDGGILCYGCNKVRDPKEYWKGTTRCKSCMLEKSKIRTKKQNQPLW